jgi:hypothetical protein
LSDSSYFVTSLTSQKCYGSFGTLQKTVTAVTAITLLLIVMPLLNYCKDHSQLLSLLTVVAKTINKSPPLLARKLKMSTVTHSFT